MLNLTKNYERATAETAARRELQVIRQALTSPEPETALREALDRHAEWLQRLIGCTAEALRGYVAYRRETALKWGLMREREQLIDSTESVLLIIRKGEVPHEA